MFNLSAANKILLVNTCMETVVSVLESMRMGEWKLFQDHRDAYFQIPIHPQSCKYVPVVHLARICVPVLGSSVSLWVYQQGISAPLSGWLAGHSLPYRNS